MFVPIDAISFRSVIYFQLCVCVSICVCVNLLNTVRAVGKAMSWAQRGTDTHTPRCRFIRFPNRLHSQGWGLILQMYEFVCLLADMLRCFLLCDWCNSSVERVHVIHMSRFLYMFICVGKCLCVCVFVCLCVQTTRTVTSPSVGVWIVQMVKLAAPTKQQTIYSSKYTHGQTHNEHLLRLLIQTKHVHCVLVSPGGGGGCGSRIITQLVFVAPYWIIWHQHFCLKKR